MALEEYFSAQVFFIILRETLESAIIVSVLLAFLKQSLLDHIPSAYDSILQNDNDEGLSLRMNSEQLLIRNTKLFNKLRVQIWLGSIAGLAVCSVIGGSFIFLFYFFETDIWAKTEHYWEGLLSIFASIIIPIMGLAMLRVNKMQEKWRVKLTNLLLAKQIVVGESNKSQSSGNRFINFSERNALFFLPFVTILREGLEAVVFVAGIGVNSPSSSIPLSFILGLVVGISVGVILYKTGDSMSLKIFLVISTCLLYLVAAGLFSKGVWQLELQHYINLCNGQDMSEVGSGPGSYDITKSVWHVNCCNGEMDGNWMLFSLILGWTNSATYGSVTSYIIYWLVVICVIRGLQYEEKYGVFPVIPISWQQKRISKRIHFQKLSDQIANTPLDSISRIDTVDSEAPLLANR